MPPFLNKVRLSGLRVGSGSSNLVVVRYDNDITVKVLDNEDDFEVVVLPGRRKRYFLDCPEFETAVIMTNAALKFRFLHGRN